MPIRSNTERVLIIGGGPVGLFVATCLAAFEIPVTLVERSQCVSDDIRASTLHPPSLEMLAPFGITDQVLAAGVIVPKWQIRNHETGENVVFDLGLIADETDFPYRVQFEQCNLCQLMDRRLQQEGIVDFRYGAELVSVDQDDDGVTIHVQSADGPEDIRGRFLVAADGGSSTVRELLKLPFDGSIYPERTVLVTTPFPFHQHIAGLSSVTYCWAASGNFSLLQLPGHWRASLYFPERMTPDQALADENIQHQLHEICPASDEFLVNDKRVYRVHQRIVRKYNHGRIVLAGDAAHLNSPSGGMGMNGGLHDAHNLAQKLDRIWRGGDLSLLDLYTRQRRPIAQRQILQQADQNRKRMTERNPKTRRQSLNELRAIVDDPIKCKDFLMKSSMIDGLREASQVT